MAIIKPYTFVAGTKAKAVEVNTNFDILYEEAGKLDRDISNIELDIQDINTSKANINGDATQKFQLANPENSYDGVNKNYLEKSISNVKDYISGFIITKDTDNSIIVSSGSCYDSTFTTMITSTGNITKENLTQTQDKTYYVYIISDSSGYNVDILITEESTAQHRPDGYTLFRSIGMYKTDENNAIQYIYQYNTEIPHIQSVLVDTYKNGSSWYRVYSDGWIEQGGLVARDNVAVYDIAFLKPFTTTDYMPLVTLEASRVAWYAPVVQKSNLTTTGMKIEKYQPDTAGLYWCVAGY